MEVRENGSFHPADIDRSLSPTSCPSSCSSRVPRLSLVSEEDESLEALRSTVVIHPRGQPDDQHSKNICRMFWALPAVIKGALTIGFVEILMVCVVAALFRTTQSTILALVY